MPDEETIATTSEGEGQPDSGAAPVETTPAPTTPDATPSDTGEMGEQAQITGLGPDHPVIQRMSKYSHENTELREQIEELQRQAGERAATAQAPSQGPQATQYPDLQDLPRDESGEYVHYRGGWMLPNAAQQAIDSERSRGELSDRLGGIEQRLDDRDAEAQRQELAGHFKGAVDSAYKTEFADFGFTDDVGEFVKDGIVRGLEKEFGNQENFDPQVAMAAIPQIAKNFKQILGHMENSVREHNIKAAKEMPVSADGSLAMPADKHPGEKTEEERIRDHAVLMGQAMEEAQ